MRKMESNEIDAFGMLKNLMNFLKTEVEITQGEVEQKANGKVLALKPGYIVRITASNSAPVEKAWPMVVFTSVNFVTDAGSGVQEWIDSHHFKVDSSKAYPEDKMEWLFSSEPFAKLQPVKAESRAFPVLNPDETAHGYVLFPGQSVVFEIGVPGENKPDPKDLNYWVDGSLSKRHPFHIIKPAV